MAQNPFTRFQTLERETEKTFYPQSPPFQYPFEVSASVENRYLDPVAFAAKYPEETLNHLEVLYRNFSWVPNKFLYSYPFPLHPHWNFLPYPFTKSVPQLVPEKWVSQFGKLPSGGISSAKFHRELDELTGTKAYHGNKLRHLKTPEAYAQILENLRSTKDHAFISTYFFHCDKGTEGLLDIIKERTEAGVRIFILMDKLAAKSHPVCAPRLRSLGARVLFPKTSITKFFHDKMFVFDGKIAQIDGQNLIAPGTMSDGTNNLFNDLSVVIEGPMVTKAGERFISNWENLAFGEMDQDLKDLYADQLARIRPLEFDGTVKDGLCRVVTKAPGKDQPFILNLFLHTARNLQHYLFFNLFDPVYRQPGGKQPSELFLDTVIDAANANPNLRVDMLTNGWLMPFHVKMPPGTMAPRNLLQRLLLSFINLTYPKPHKEMERTRQNLLPRLNGTNFHWWVYAQFMHSKTLMADNVWTIIGSYNINKTAEKSSHEMVVACYDRKLAEDMQKSFIVDALNSIPVPLAPDL